MELVAVALLLLHGPDGHEIRVNPKHIISLKQAAIPGDNKYVVGGANCVVNLVDGKFVSVVERCVDIQHHLEGN